MYTRVLVCCLIRISDVRPQSAFLFFKTRGDRSPVSRGNIERNTIIIIITISRR